MDRFDVEEKANKIMMAMVEKNIIDLKDVYSLAVNFRENFEELIEELAEINYSNWHTDNKTTREIMEVIQEIQSKA